MICNVRCGTEGTENHREEEEVVVAGMMLKRGDLPRKKIDRKTQSNRSDAARYYSYYADRPKIYIK